MNQISAEQLKKDLESNKEITLINVLDKECYNDCKIPGSINIPYKSDMQKAVEDWDEDTYIIVYCASSECPASKEAEKKLTQMGFANVFLYEGGIREWKQKGYKTEGACTMSYTKEGSKGGKKTVCCQGKCDGNCKGKCTCKSSMCDCNGKKQSSGCSSCKGKCTC